MERDAQNVAAELAERLDELDARPADVRLRYEDLAGDLEGTAKKIAEYLNIELTPSDVERPTNHVTTASVAASVGRWRGELSPLNVAALTSIAERLGY